MGLCLMSSGTVRGRDGRDQLVSRSWARLSDGPGDAEASPRSWIGGPSGNLLDEVRPTGELNSQRLNGVRWHIRCVQMLC